MGRIGLTLALTGLLTWQAATAATLPTSADFARYAETLLTDAYSTDEPGVAVLVMRGDEVLYRGARGEADVEGDVPLQPADRFRIASIAKQIAAAGLLTLVDAGKVSLDDPLSKYLPDYPGGASIRVGQLLNHTSGVKDYSPFDGPVQRDLTTAQLVDYFKKEEPEFAPGEGHQYNGAGYVLVGAVIEAASGQAWHRYLEQALFEPLGMTDTGYGADPAVVARQVQGYNMFGEAPAAPPQISMTQWHAGGALVSTVDDLTRWNRALHEGRVLKPDTYTRMITPVGKAKNFEYGYGIQVTRVRGAPAFHHSGGIPGFSSHLIYVQGPDVSVAVLQNSGTTSPVQQPYAIARRLAGAAVGKPYPLVEPVAVDVEVLKQYEGVYRVDAEGTRRLRVVDGKLVSHRTVGMPHELTPVAADTFMFPDGISRIKVVRDTAGKITGTRYWDDGEGVSVFAPLTDQPLPVDTTP